MEVLAQTRVVLWEGGSLWLVDAARFEGESRSTDFHAHHAIQVTFSLGGTFRLVAEDEASTATDTVVAADGLHRFEAEGRIALLFVEPESRLGRGLSARHISGILTELAPSPLLAAELEVFKTSDWRAPDSEIIAWGRRLVGVLAADERAEIPDYRIRKVIAWASERLDRTLSLADARPGRGPFVEPASAPVRRADRLAVQDLPSMAEAQPSGRYRGGRVTAYRGGARGWVLGFSASQPYFQADVRGRSHCSADADLILRSSAETGRCVNSRNVR